jgi:ribosomal protein S18 acetylase RimI-like enzyme
MALIEKINFQKINLVTKLYELQRTSYLIEAELIHFFDIPPLKESFDEFLKCGENFLGYFEKNELAGALSYTIDGEELTICRMIVHPDHFRKGIAQNLLHELEASNKECAVLKVSTGKENIPATRLYLKNGYQLVGELEVAPNFFISNFEKRTRTVGTV